MIREKADPLNLFADWYSEAEKSEPNDPSAMSLATVGPDGTPSVRMVFSFMSKWPDGSAGFLPRNDWVERCE